MASIAATVYCKRCKAIYVIEVSHYGGQQVHCPRGHGFWETIKKT